MKSLHLLRRFFITCHCLVILSCANQFKDQETANSFISQMVATHQFEEASLNDLFDKVELNKDIIKKISSPSESLPWYKYRQIFLKEPRIKAGVQFWRENEKTLTITEKETGIPAAIIVAIIGVETQYGQHTGHYRVIDALSTLAFAYPPRSRFFRNELEQFLLLCREEHIDPLTPTGSYAGAMGMPQFMPSSYRHYAVDFNKDSKRDIWHNPSDVIASIGNYFYQHQWQKGQPVAIYLGADSENKPNLNIYLKQNLRNLKLQSSNSKNQRSSDLTTKAKILAFELNESEELWAVLDNFFVITRYNKSPLYAMAVFQLSRAISNQRVSSFYEQNFNHTVHSGS